MLQKKLIQNYKKATSYIFLGFFSFFINFYYGSLGILPIDGFSHFDTGYRILLGEFPFKDYWVISGPAIDYIQALFFYFFGASWTSYLSHSSFLNLLITLFTFYFFSQLKIKSFYSFFYALFFSILAYPSSGTPFVDHHSTFFSLIAIYMIILNFNKISKIFCFFIPILFFLAFFSKQVPSTYLIISSAILILTNIIIEKKLRYLKYYIYGIIISSFIIFLIGYFSELTFNDFLIQYIYDTPSIGSERIDNLNFGFKNLFLDFKFIHLLLIPFILIFLLNLSKKKKHFFDADFFRFCLILSMVLSLIFHQLITQNQIFLFFLIPLLAGFLHLEIEKNNSKNKIYFLIIFIVTIYATQKYHYRFNEGRKFHELINVDFRESIDARKIDLKLKYLKWITPFEQNPAKEIAIINKSKNYIENNSRNLMVITNYSFYSTILNKKLHSPIRWYIPNGNSHPSNENKYYFYYKKFLIKKIIDNNIEEIITININDDMYIDYLLSDNCYIKKNKITKTLVSHLIKKCATNE